MKFVWLDLETTGLDPETCSILEIAIQIDEHAKSFVVHFDGDVSKLHPVVIDMHTKNGLFEECKQGRSLDEVQDEVVAWLTGLGCNSKDFYLAGNSVHFDLRFLIKHMPKIPKMLSYRILDVTSLRLFFESIGIPAPEKKLAHRAAPDIEESRAQFNYYTQFDIY